MAVQHEDTRPDQAGGQSLASRGCGVLGCLLVIAILVGLGFGAAALSGAIDPLIDRVRSPADVVREYMLSLEEGNRDRALRFLCGQLREGTGAAAPPDPVGALAGDEGWRWAGVEDEFPYPRSGGQVAIYYEIEQLGTGSERRGQALLVDEGGWRICGFTE